VLTHLLDTNCSIYLLRGSHTALTARVAEADAGSLAISSVSFAEMAVGYGKRIHEAPEIAGFLEEVSLLPFDEAAAKLYGTLSFRRGSFDRLIAAHALSLDLTLVTNNERDFADVPGLRIENWTRP